MYLPAAHSDAAGFLTSMSVPHSLLLRSPQGLLHLLEAASAGFVVDMHSMSPALQRLLSSSVLYVSASQCCSAAHLSAQPPNLPALPVHQPAMLACHHPLHCSPHCSRLGATERPAGRATVRVGQGSWQCACQAWLLLCLASRLLGCAAQLAVPCLCNGCDPPICDGPNCRQPARRPCGSAQAAGHRLCPVHLPARVQ